jgi:hypothetical protein
MSDSIPAVAVCLVCERTGEAVPLLALTYQGRAIHICPQDLPILIHQPAKLADKLPGADGFGKAASH